MNKSESIQNLSAALSKAQAEMPAIKFDSKNPFLKKRLCQFRRNHSGGATRNREARSFRSVNSLLAKTGWLGLKKPC